MTAAVKKTQQPTQEDQKAGNAKSGLRVLEPGEILFNEGEVAQSLYIIQKGQLRLFRPKGRGFVELAILRTGEVIGEMAFFDDNGGGGGRRSCSAEAMVRTEIIEISFQAFGKVLGNLNPWFKTIITTLANRLRATNGRIKELESNSLSYNDGVKEYKFIKENELLKILSTLFLIFHTHGDKDAKGRALVTKNSVNLYCREIYNIMEVKLEAVLNILMGMGIIDQINDQNGLPNIFGCKDVNFLRSLFVFYNGEKYLTDDKRLNIGSKTKTFLEELYLGINKGTMKAEEPEGKKVSPWKMVDVSPILSEFKYRNISINVDDLDDAREAKIVGEAYVVSDSEMKLEVSIERLKKLMPIIRFMDAFNKVNESKNK
ncbi:MAG: cyclic nucleotide-binding domain-containing protein [Halobacteriovoraceae bacterium]|nr:cyclic nucleotide-binding domain-containing protein [Halobacteriovoraceae bacterium]MCB9093992.1 cyclic nucleotide-binding domain-containing protein [Halobacteriovoraceae bacterium]